jgi:hypothetical protein
MTREHLLQASRIHEDVFDRSIDVQILRPAAGHVELARCHCHL